MIVSRWLSGAAVALLFVLHQDFWFWRSARPMVFGLPVGLLYHAGYCFACSLLMWFLVRQARRGGGSAP
jgi:hypothetical protein